MNTKYKLILPLTVAALLAAGCNSTNNSSYTNPPASDNQQAAQQTPSNNPTANSTTPPTTQNVVTYTDSGFSPATLTIKNGDTVTFKNNASDAMWVASNPHPVHTDYPGFDAKKSIVPGASYQFTFTKSGSWGFHNHLNPSEGGKIVVQ